MKLKHAFTEETPFYYPTVYEIRQHGTCQAVYREKQGTVLCLEKNLSKDTEPSPVLYSVLYARMNNEK